MRKLLAFILALGLILGLAACGDIANDSEILQESTMRMDGPFDLDGYQSMLKAFTMHPQDYAKRRGTYDGLRLEVATDINAMFRPLREYKGELPDEAVLAFLQWFMPVCYSLGSDTEYADPQVYPYTAYEPGENGGVVYRPNYAYMQFDLMGKPSPGMARWLTLKENETTGWQAFEAEYPALASKIADARYTLFLDGKEQEFTLFQICTK